VAGDSAHGGVAQKEGAVSRQFLFSIDLEDVRDWMADGQRYAERVPAMTERYLEFLRRHGKKATFFVVGDVARRYPALIRAIAQEGHELACHTDRHVPLERLNAQELKQDLQRNRELLPGEVVGFRAPIFSLMAATAWAYEVLAELSFRYSSSVLPAKNPLYGWEGFGQECRRIHGVLEIPVTLLPLGGLTVPFGGGVYFRALPWPVLRWAFRSSRQAVTSYFHPYDIDEGQERFMHPGIRDRRWYNWLMYYNRGSVFPKLERILEMGFDIVPYREFAAAQTKS
jgi:polysaccharide deacetylase family protein (PEP-CTERM system associated)